MGNTFSRRRPSSQPEFSNAIATGVPIATGIATVTEPSADSAPSAGHVNATALNAQHLSLSVCADKIALASDEEHTLTAMLSIKAPAAPDQVTRPPIDLVACIDRSGSMQGQKISLMKKTLELLVKRAGLKSDDRISLVSFDNTVKLEMDLTAMNAEGRHMAEGVVMRLQPGATTNLSDYQPLRRCSPVSFIAARPTT